jgi:hypothetical protein
MCIWGTGNMIKNWDLCITLEGTIQTKTSFTIREPVDLVLSPPLLWAHHTLCLRSRLHSGAGMLYRKWHSFSILGSGSADGYLHTVQGTPDPRFSARLLMRQSLNVRSVFLFAAKDQYITIDLWIIMFSSFLYNFFIQPWIFILFQ